MPLTTAQAARHAVQLHVPGMGEGQERLAAARVRVVGAGRAVAPALIALAQAGVGRIWVDDPEAIAEADTGGWLLAPGTSGARGDEVAARLAALVPPVRVERYPAGGVPTATLVCAPTVAERLVAAEQARRAGVPHVVLEPDAEGGSVVTVLPGAPCYSCARATSLSSRPPEPGGAVLACLAALELVLAISFSSAGGGRRIDVVRGLPIARATVRLAGCSCAPGAKP